MIRLALILCCLLAHSALAQSTTPIPDGYVGASAGQTTLSASTTSALVGVTAAPLAWVENHGLVPVCVSWGDGSTIAQYPCAQDHRISPGHAVQFAIKGAADVAAITPTGTASLLITTGHIVIGNPAPVGTVLLGVDSADCMGTGTGATDCLGV